MYHGDSDSMEQLQKDADPRGHTPDSVRQSAERELSRRGYQPSALLPSGKVSIEPKPGVNRE